MHQPTGAAPLVDDVVVEQVGGREVDVEPGLPALRVLLDVGRVSVRRVRVVDDHLQPATGDESLVSVGVGVNK